MKIEVDEKKLVGLIEEEIKKEFERFGILEMPKVSMGFDMETAKVKVTLSVDGIEPESFYLLIGEAVESAERRFVAPGRVSQVLEKLARNPGLKKEFSKTDAEKGREAISEKIKCLAQDVRAFKTDFPDFSYKNENDLFSQISDFVFNQKRGGVFIPCYANTPIPDDDIPF